MKKPLPSIPVPVSTPAAQLRASCESASAMPVPIASTVTMQATRRISLGSECVSADRVRSPRSLRPSFFSN